MTSSFIPSRIFIVPYRDRLNQKNEFLRRIKILLEDSEQSEPYEIYFAHQCDKRPFNRGAMKNIGFLAIKKKYPNDYKNITLIFHDVDTWPSAKGLIDYNTTQGIVKHYYGYYYALGGIFSIKAGDYERTLGFPNFWGWGLEDNAMNDRVLKTGLKIDRSTFYKINDPKILRPFDGYNRTLSKREGNIYKYENPDNFLYINNLKYNIINENEANKVFSINIYNFTCKLESNSNDYYNYDIRKGNKIKVDKLYYRRPWSMDFIINK